MSGEGGNLPSLAGLSPETILKFGELEQGAQGMRNRSSYAISDAMYKNALQEYYNKQAQNQRRAGNQAFEISKGKLRLQQIREYVQNRKDLTAAQREALEIDLINNDEHWEQEKAKASLANVGETKRRHDDVARHEQHTRVMKEIDSGLEALKYEADSEFKQERMKTLRAERGKIRSGISQDIAYQLSKDVKDYAGARANASSYNNSVASDDETWFYYIDPENEKEIPTVQLFDENGEPFTKKRLQVLADHYGSSVTEIFSEMQRQYEDSSEPIDYVIPSDEYGLTD